MTRSFRPAPKLRKAAHGEASSKSPLLQVLVCLAAAALLGGAVHWLTRIYKSEAAHAGYVELDWGALIPKAWDPLKRYRDKALGEPLDTDPGALELARQMREAWDKAPTNNEMNGAKVRLVGYVVPLEASKGELKEFLLVPYFGACIHVPPPPANQIVHVSLAEPAMDVRTMDLVSVTGTLSTARNMSAMGMSAYSMDAVQVEKRAIKGWYMRR